MDNASYPTPLGRFLGLGWPCPSLGTANLPLPIRVSAASPLSLPSLLVIKSYFGLDKNNSPLSVFCLNNCTQLPLWALNLWSLPPCVLTAQLLPSSAQLCFCVRLWSHPFCSDGKEWLSKGCSLEPRCWTGLTNLCGFVLSSPVFNNVSKFIVSICKLDVTQSLDF